MHLVTSNPWDRQPGEGDTSYLAFLHYRDSGYPKGATGPFHPRNMKRLGPFTGHEPRVLLQWFNQWHWATRAGAYDRWLAAERHGETPALEAAAEMRADHGRLMAKAFTFAEAELDKWIHLAEVSDVPVAKPRELALLMDLVMKNQRLLTGQHTDHIRADGEWDLEALSVEELERLETIRKIAKGKG